jgi:hypothetical protein
LRFAKPVSGFPPSDDDVLHFLVYNHEANVSSRLQCFLLALFEKTAKTIDGLGEDIATRITKFREFMSKGQRMELAGRDRVQFYRCVVDRAEEVRRVLFILAFSCSLLSKLLSGSPPTIELLSEALERLRTALHTGSGPQESVDEHCIYARTSKDIFVDVFIMFDEAHTLVKATGITNQSRFVVLCQILSSLSSCPLFTFFLSTTGSIMQFPQPFEQGFSTSGTIPPGPPYIYLGFDQLMQSHKVLDRWKTLDDVTSLECAARMGRPL